jgi:hypothetical protein
MENIYDNWILNYWENPMKNEKALYLDSLVLNRDELVLTFDSDTSRYIFKYAPHCPVRIIDESFRLGLWSAMKNKGILGKSPTWIVEHSDFIRHLDHNGEWSHFNPSSNHYLFITCDHVIDIVSSEKPEITKEIIQTSN